MPLPPAGRYFPSSLMDNRLFLLDAYALIYRAYWGFASHPLMNAEGINTSATYGFLKTLQEVLETQKPTHIAVCFDPKGGTFRHSEYPEYKAQRDAQPEGITVAVPYIKRILDAYRIPVIEVPGYEADDVIGTLSRLADETGRFETFMLTPDKDYFQLVTDHSRVLRPRTKTAGFDLYGIDEVKAKYGIRRTDQVIDLLGLMGDAADNIPGCPGVGEKTAVKLINEWNSIEGLLSHVGDLKGAIRTKVEENADKIRLSRHLVTIVRDVPDVILDEEALRLREPDLQTLADLFTELSFRRERDNVYALLRKSGKSSAPAAGKTLRPAPAADGQLDLFADFESAGDDSADAPPASQPAAPAVAEQVSASDPADVVSALMFAPRWAMSVVATDSDPMRARLSGIAFASEDGTYFWVPLSGEDNVSAVPPALETLRPLLESEACEKVAHDFKPAWILLRRYGIDVAAPAFDTMVAHYLLAPSQSHDLWIVAQSYLPDLRDMSLPAASDDPSFASLQAQTVLRLCTPLGDALRRDNMMPLFRDIEMPLIKVLGDMQITGVRIDLPALHESEEALNRDLREIQEQLFRAVGRTFNPLSPRDVGTVLFDELGFEPKPAKNAKGNYPTNEDTLNKLRDRDNIVANILAYRGVQKLLSTYVKALPSMINPDTGRIHARFNQTVTETGRLSSSDPNLQNIPVRDALGRELRKAFRPDEGEVWFSADYSQIELRLMAHLSQDPHMVEAFRQGQDIHAATAAKIYKSDIGEVTPEQRRRAKTANFGIIYGISAFGLSTRLNISRSDAKQLIDDYFSNFPHVQTYMKESIERARAKGYAETLFGRRSWLPDLESANGKNRGTAERNAINTPIQGSAADIIKIAMVRIHRRLLREHLHAKLLIQVHDELNFSVPVAELERTRQLVLDEMAGAYPMSVPLYADCGQGDNWLEAH